MTEAELHELAELLACARRAYSIPELEKCLEAAAALVARARSRV